jgi:hypothetical protein
MRDEGLVIRRGGRHRAARGRAGHILRQACAALRFRERTLAATTAPDPGSFVLHVAVEEKDWLLERGPATFWQTDQHRDWPAILVR